MAAPPTKDAADLSIEAHAKESVVPTDVAHKLAALANIPEPHVLDFTNDLRDLFAEAIRMYHWRVDNGKAREKIQKEMQIIEKRVAQLLVAIDRLDEMEKKYLGLFRLMNSEAGDEMPEYVDRSYIEADDFRIKYHELINEGYLQVSSVAVSDFAAELREWRCAAKLGTSDAEFFSKRPAHAPKKATSLDPAHPKTKPFDYFILRLGCLVRGFKGDLSYVNDSCTGELIDFLAEAETHLPKGFVPFRYDQPDEEGKIKGKTLLRTLRNQWPKKAV